MGSLGHHLSVSHGYHIMVQGVCSVRSRGLDLEFLFWPLSWGSCLHSCGRWGTCGSGRSTCKLLVLSQVHELSNQSCISTHCRRVQLTNGHLLFLGLSLLRSDFVFFGFVSPFWGRYWVDIKFVKCPSNTHMCFGHQHPTVLCSVFSSMLQVGISTNFREHILISFTACSLGLLSSLVTDPISSMWKM